MADGVSPDWGELREYGERQRLFQESGYCAECPDDDCCEIQRIEVSFALPVHMTQDQQRRLLDLLNEMVRAPCSQPKEGVHWVGFTGSKLNYSAADARLLEREAGPDYVPDGAEPTSDDTVFCVESCARAFVSTKERDRVMRERSAS